MNEKLAAIDESSIEDLQRIKSEQDVVLERLERMDKRKSEISEEVFERVRVDYQSRLDDLEEQAEPLKETARGEYRALKAVTEEIEAIVKNADLDREELELRHEVGEFDDEAYEAHLADHEAKFAGHQADLELAVALKDRFRSAFRSPDDLEPQTRSSRHKASAVELSLETLGGQRIVTPPEEPPPAPESGAEEDLPGEEETAVFAPDETGDGRTDNETTAPLPVDQQPALDDDIWDPDADDAPEGATMILNWPTLIVQVEGGEREEHSVVGASTVLGGTPDCDVVVAGPRVADRHAEIVMTAGGYLIRDLGTPVGTLVNGVVVSEWKLSDGDLIQIGEVVLLFKAGGP